MKENESLKEAQEKLEKISEDARMQQLAWWKEKAIYEENTAKQAGYERGLEEGLEKIKKEKIKIVKNMLKENMSIETISKVTNLDANEIKQIQQNM